MPEGNRAERDLGVGPAAVLQAMHASVRLLRWGLLLLVIVYLTSGVTLVRPNETAFVLRFGKLQPGLHAPGLLLALPPPVDEVVKVPTRSVQELNLDDWMSSAATDAPGADYTPELGDSLDPVRDGYTLSGDANIIRASFSVRYQIADPVAYVLTARGQSTLLAAILYQAATETIAQLNVDDVLATGLEALRAHTLQTAQAQLDRLGLGVRLLAFEVRAITPARQVLPAFEDVVSARVESRTLVERANGYRAAELPGARAEAYRFRREADANAQERVAKATGEAAAFAAIDQQYRAAPQLMRTRLYADAMSSILPNLKSAVIVPPDARGPKLLLQPASGAAAFPASEMEGAPE